MRLVYTGAWQRGLALVTKAIALNPAHPEWYQDPIVFYRYQTGDYEGALAVAQTQQVLRPWRFLFEAMILGQLDRSEQARPAIEAVLKLGRRSANALGYGARLERAGGAHRAHGRRPA